MALPSSGTRAEARRSCADAVLHRLLLLSRVELAVAGW
ncbi:hypothetical protein ABIA30_005147 [Mycobacterium sp. MAA66]|jgi:hypothetical protein